MATIRAYTTIEQSRKLAQILPLESADMEYMFWKWGDSKVSTVPFVKNEDEPEWPDDSSYDFILCWSLAALLDIIPYPTLGKHANETWSCASWVETTNPYFMEGCDSPINACYEMIIKLSELKML